MLEHLDMYPISRSGHSPHRLNWLSLPCFIGFEQVEINRKNGGLLTINISMVHLFWIDFDCFETPLYIPPSTHLPSTHLTQGSIKSDGITGITSDNGCLTTNGRDLVIRFG